MKHLAPEDNPEHMTALREFKENPELFINRAKAGIVVAIRKKRKVQRFVNVVYSHVDNGEWTIGYLDLKKMTFRTYSCPVFYARPHCLVINGQTFLPKNKFLDDEITVDQVKIALKHLDLILTTEGLDG